MVETKEQRALGKAVAEMAKARPELRPWLHAVNYENLASELEGTGVGPDLAWAMSSQFRKELLMSAIERICNRAKEAALNRLDNIFGSAEAAAIKSTVGPVAAMELLDNWPTVKAYMEQHGYYDKFAKWPDRKKRMVIDDIKRHLRSLNKAPEFTSAPNPYGRAFATVAPGYTPHKYDGIFGSVTGSNKPHVMAHHSADQGKACYEFITAWAGGELRIERSQGHSLHHLIDWLSSENTIAAKYGERQRTANELVQTLKAINWHNFVIQHDWARLFKDAKMSADDEKDDAGIALPYDFCCYEVRLSSVRVLALCSEKDGQVHMSMCYGMKGAWVIDRDTWTLHMDGSVTSTGAYSKTKAAADFDRVARLVLAQIRAVNIMMEAEVAETETVRASYKLNRQLEAKGRAPQRDYHVVDLWRRKRYSPVPDELRNGEPGNSRRLHLRRSHWRHYQNYRLRIKWMLVGNPELGWVDKEYRL